MARTVIPIVKASRNTQLQGGTLAAPLAGGGGIAIDQANGMSIAPKRSGRVAIFWYNSAAGAHILTIRAGLNPPALEAGAGDLVFASVPTVGFGIVPGLDGSRFAQAGGLLNVDFDAGTTGVIWAVEMPS